MQLLLVQHGEAASEAEDPARPLTAAGSETVGKMAAWARAAGVEVSAIRHSGKARAEQTARRFAEELAPAQGVVAADGLAPKDDVRPLARELETAHESLMLVGHLPHLARLAGLLLNGDAERCPVAFANAGIVCLERDGTRWRLAWALPPARVP